MSKSITGGLTSIIVPACDQWSFTQLCLRALFERTRPPWELIVVDNGSTDGTGIYLEGVRDAAPVPVTVIANAENLGFPRAINQGLRAARGAYLVLLNNDAVVTDGWLDQLIGLSNAPIRSRVRTDRVPASDRDTTQGSAQPTAGREAGIGLVGPMSNYAAPPQLVEDVPYRDLDAMHAFARSWRDQHRGKWFTAARLSGFCLLIKREVYEAVGGLDERFGPGLFDDDDLAVRARRAGFELAVAHDLFIHHFGSRTFAGQGIDAGRLLEENAARFAEKWGSSVTPGRRVALSSWSGAPDRTGRLGGDTTSPGSSPEDVGPGMERPRDPGPNCPLIRPSATSTSPNDIGPGVETARDHGPDRPLIRPSATFSPSGRRGRPSASVGDGEGPAGRRARVSLTMIVRDEEQNLPHCLESVRGVFDEIVVVDTGSVDRTREIAREFGAKVFEFAWIDDFAAARNAALEHATGDYAFWLDADDVIEAVQREKLIALLGGLQPWSGGAEWSRRPAVGSMGGVGRPAPNIAGPPVPVKGADRFGRPSVG